MKLKKSVSQHTVEAYAVCSCSYVLRCACTCNCTSLSGADKAINEAPDKAPSWSAAGNAANRTA